METLAERAEERGDPREAVECLAEAHAALGFARMVAAFDFIAAEAHLRRAVQLDPSQGRFREWLVGPLLWMGRTDEALDGAERALAIDSMSPSANAELARALVTAGLCRIDRAFAGFERVIEDHSLTSAPDHFTMLDVARESLADDPRFEELSRQIGLVAPGTAEN